ncbi:hypothetical protein BKA66DRAFT_565472 [Pyrenochaeta sp. MPI-SDFR-AT-0127]|nr:hypothetical protein BKA66DRAFT_565472 [Pyrenochaeta sp. MPI-SDFR-AT-0127]
MTQNIDMSNCSRNYMECNLPCLQVGPSEPPAIVSPSAQLFVCTIFTGLDLMQTLSLELRQQIYHHVLVGDATTLDAVVRVNPANTTKLSSLMTPYWSLASISGNIRSEVQHYLSRFRFVLLSTTHDPFSLAEKFCGLHSWNRALIHRIMIPYFSIELFGSEGTYTKDRLQATLPMIKSRFPALKQLDLGLNVKECIPWPSKLHYLSIDREYRDTNEQSLSMILSKTPCPEHNLRACYIPLRFCLWEFALAKGKQKNEIKLGIFWFENEEIRNKEQFSVKLLEVLKKQFLALMTAELEFRVVDDKGALPTFETS